MPTRQLQRSSGGRGNGRFDPSSQQRTGTQGRFNPRTQERKAFGATEEDHYYEEDYTSLPNSSAFSASAHPDCDNWNEEEEDRRAMMGRRDYDFTDFNDDDEGQA